MTTTTLAVSRAEPTEQRAPPAVEGSTWAEPSKLYTRVAAEDHKLGSAHGQSDERGQQHSLLLSIALHLLPGIVTLAIYLIMGPFVRGLGHPEELGRYLLALPLGVIALELGIMFAVGKRRSGRLSLRGVILYRESMPLWQYGVLGLALLAWNAINYIPVQQVTSEWLNSTVFAWVPRWFTAQGDYST
jgi:hypothetical protein